MDKKLLEIAQKDYAVQERLYKQIESQVKLGNRVQINLLTQEVQLKSGEVQIIKLKNQLNNDKLGFANLLAIRPDKEFEILALNIS